MTERTHTVAELAAALIISEKTIRRRIRQGKIRATNVGTPRRHVYRIPHREFVRLVEGGW